MVNRTQQEVLSETCTKISCASLEEAQPNQSNYDPNGTFAEITCKFVEKYPNLETLHIYETDRDRFDKLFDSVWVNPEETIDQFNKFKSLNEVIYQNEEIIEKLINVAYTNTVVYQVRKNGISALKVKKIEISQGDGNVYQTENFT